MKTLAYCANSFRGSVRRAAGVTPLTSPPLTSNDFIPAAMVGCDFLYFKLHGLKNEPFWYGDDFLTAINGNQFKDLDLTGTVAYVANCYTTESPMMNAIKDTGAILIGGPGRNYGGRSRLIGSDLLGFWLRISLQTGIDVVKSLEFSKMMVKGHARVASGKRKQALKDALEFKVL